MKKLIAVFMTFCAVMGIGASAKTVQVSIDSKDVFVSDEHIMKSTLDAAAYIDNDITMVPLRFITETFGSDVQWNHDTKEITITNSDQIIVLKIGDINAVVQKGAEASSSTLLSAPVIVNDITLVPLRFVSENLGASVKYVAPTRQVLITDEAPAVTVGDTEIYKSLFRTYYLMNSAYSFYYGEELFNQLVYDNVIGMAALKSQWSMVDPDDSVNEGDLEYVNSMTDDQWALEGILKADVVQLLQLSSVSSRAFEMLANASDDNTVNDYYINNYVCAKHVLLSTIDEQTGEPMTDAKKKSVKSKAQTVLTKAKNRADFDKLIEQYGEDPGMIANPDGYVFTYGEMVEPFEEAAFALKDNALSGIVETDYGYHIIKKLPLPEITEDVQASIRSALADGIVQTMITATPITNNMPYEELSDYLSNSSVG